MWDFEAIGLPALRDEFTRVEEGLDDPEPGLAMIAPEVGADVRRNFEQGGRPGVWPDITAKSRDQRTENKTGGPLVDTEALMDAASADKPGVAGSTFSLEGDTLTLGTDLIYAATQEYGRGGIPARPYEQITDEDAVRVQEAFEGDYLHALLAGAPVV